MSKLNDKNYIKFHLEELEGFSKFLKGKINELDGSSNIFKSKYSYIFDYLKFVWKWKSFRYLVLGIGLLLLLFGLSDLFSVDDIQSPQLPSVEEQGRPKGMLSRFASFLGNVESKISKAFYYILRVCIAVGCTALVWYMYRRVKGIPLDAPFLPGHSEAGTQHSAQDHTQTTQTINQDTVSESLPLEGPLNQDDQNLIEPVESNRPAKFCCIIYDNKLWLISN